MLSELSAKAAADAAARIQRDDERARLAAEAFATGQWDTYWDAEVADLERRIDQHFAVGESEINQR